VFWASAVLKLLVDWHGKKFLKQPLRKYGNMPTLSSFKSSLSMMLNRRLLAVEVNRTSQVNNPTRRNRWITVQSVERTSNSA
jgi:hypothetical protein